MPAPSPEALAQVKERQRREAELSSFGRNKVKNSVGTLLKGVLATRKDINAAEVSPLGGLSTMTGSGSSTVLPPSWAANIVSLEEIREEEANQTSAATNASYPPPMPRLTPAQQQIHKKTDLLQSTSAAAVATANASKEALSLVGSALSYMVPKVLQDAPRYMLEGAVDSVGVNLTSYDLSGLEQAARVSFFKMEREAPLTGLTIAFKRLMITLRDFKFNKVNLCLVDAFVASPHQLLKIFLLRLIFTFLHFYHLFFHNHATPSISSSGCGDRAFAQALFNPVGLFQALHRCHRFRGHR